MEKVVSCTDDGGVDEADLQILYLVRIAPLSLQARSLQTVSG